MNPSATFQDALDHGIAVIVQSRLVRHRCEAVAMRARNLAEHFLRRHPSMTCALMRGSSEPLDDSRPREVWVHRPTSRRWIVVRDRAGVPVSAVGPFGEDVWDPLLRDYVPLDGRHALAWLREHIHDFVRDGDGEPR